MPDFSDFIVFADESGDHTLKGVDATFPMFCLSFCLVSKPEYAAEVVPKFQQFKFDFWGHDAVVLHEHEIRKQKNQFKFLMGDPKRRQLFFERLNTLMTDAPVSIIAAALNKDTLVKTYTDPWNPYEVTLYFCMERLLQEMLDHGQEGKIVHVLFESRGKKEDTELEVEFRRICSNGYRWGYRKLNFSKIQFEPVFVSKAANSTGLQLADLTARPIALKSLRPKQENRAYDIIEPKLSRLKFFP